MVGNSELMRVTRNLGNLDVADAAASAALPVALPGNSAAAAKNMLLQYATPIAAFFQGNGVTFGTDLDGECEVAKLVH